MTILDAIAIVFGAVLGLLIALVKDTIDHARRRKRVERMLALQMPTILDSLNIFAKSGNKQMISITELPLLDSLVNEDIVCLDRVLASDTYKLRTLLRKAEESRKVASSLLDNQNTSAFKLHVLAYSESLNAALSCAKEIYEKLKCQPALQRDAATLYP